jgi:hypothetical protein
MRLGPSQTSISGRKSSYHTACKQGEHVDHRDYVLAFVRVLESEALLFNQSVANAPQRKFLLMVCRPSCSSVRQWRLLWAACRTSPPLSLILMVAYKFRSISIIHLGLSGEVNAQKLLFISDRMATVCGDQWFVALWYQLRTIIVFL